MKAEVHEKKINNVLLLQLRPHQENSHNHLPIQMEENQMKSSQILIAPSVI